MSAPDGQHDPAPIDATGVMSNLGFLVRLSQQVMYEEFHRRVGIHGVTPARYSLLCLLRDNPASPMTTLAAGLRIKPSNFAVLVQDMQKDGLVRRRADDLDRRRTLVELSPGGEQMLRMIGPKIEAMEAGFLEELGPVLLSRLKAGLTRLLDTRQDPQDQGARDE